MFLINSEYGEKLYDYAKALPVVDYHNHLSVTDIAEDTRFFDVYELWIKPDPYKHRAMRMCGVEEKFITGEAGNEEKFIKWCETLPKLIGNPLYHWSIMELESVFGITDITDGQEMYNRCNDFLKENNVSVSSLMKKFNVEHSCPCMSLFDEINEKVTPSLRGDDIVNLPEEFVQKINVKNLKEFEEFIVKRLGYFYSCGCRFSDHAIDDGFEYFSDDGQNDSRFELLLDKKLDDDGKKKLSSYLLTFLAKEYAKIGFTMQLHIGAQRFTSTKLRIKAGAAGGFAGIGNSVNVKALTLFLDDVDMSETGLPKTILFTLNPADNALISVLSGSYSKDGVAGLITQGPAWWWCDHKDGILNMLENTAAFGVLSNFVGMTTDSRSFLSFVRHDYFRRILCDWLGKKVETGEFPKNLNELIYRICYKNAKDLMI